MVRGWINDTRVAQGLVAFRAWDALDTLATARAGRIAATRTLSHEAAGGNCGDALTAAGIPWSWYGETLGMSPATFGETSARQIFDLWMGSTAHRDILMSAVDNYVGIGVAQSGDGSTWMSVVATESPDHTPPVATAVSLRRSGTTLTFTWRGTDPLLQTHTAGIRSYDVQVRKGSGAWWLAANDTTATSLMLGNRPHGYWFSFRVQAADRRGTLSPWTSTMRIWVP
jgi:hypothetical protein